MVSGSGRWWRQILFVLESAYHIRNCSELVWAGLNLNGLRSTMGRVKVSWAALEQAGSDWAGLCICLIWYDNVRSLQRLLDAMSFSNAQFDFIIK